MPKHFSVTDDTKGFHLTPDAPVHRPHLAIDIARVATYWSDVELFWSIAYAYLMSGKNDTDAFAEYYGLRDWRKRRKLFFSQAKTHSLPSILRDEATDLYTEFEKTAHARNRIVHGTWAWSEEHPDSLFLAQARSLGSNLHRVFTALSKIAERPRRYPQLSVNLSRGPYEEWSHQDFEDAVAEIRDLRTRVDDFGNKVAAHSLEVFVRKLKQH